jgi:hypothetical protein
MIEDIPNLPKDELIHTSRSNISKSSKSSRHSRSSNGSKGSKKHIIRERDKVVDPCMCFFFIIILIYIYNSFII